MTQVSLQAHQTQLTGEEMEYLGYDSSRNDIISVPELKKAEQLDEFVSRFIYTEDTGIALYYAQRTSVGLEQRIKKVIKKILSDWEANPEAVTLKWGFDAADITRLQKWVTNGLTNALDTVDNEALFLSKSDYVTYASSEDKPIRKNRLETIGKLDEFIGLYIRTKRYVPERTDKYYDSNLDNGLRYQIRDYLKILIGDDIIAKDALRQQLGLNAADVHKYLFQEWLATDFNLDSISVYGGFNFDMGQSLSYGDEIDEEGNLTYIYDVDENSASAGIEAEVHGQKTIGNNGFIRGELGVEGEPIAVVERLETVRSLEEGDDIEEPELETVRSGGANVDGELEMGRLDGKVGLELKAGGNFDFHDMPNEDVRRYDVGAEFEANDFGTSGTAFEASFEHEQDFYNPPEEDDVDEYYHAESAETAVDVDMEYTNPQDVRVTGSYDFDHDESKKYYRKEEETSHRGAVSLHVPLTQDDDKRNHTLDITLSGKHRTRDKYRSDTQAAYEQVRHSAAADVGVNLDVHDDFSVRTAVYGQVMKSEGSQEYVLPYLQGELSFDYTPGKFSLDSSVTIGGDWGNVTYNDVNYSGIDDSYLAELPTSTEYLNVNGSFGMSYAPRDFMSFSLNGWGGYEMSSSYQDHKHFYAGARTSYGMRLAQKKHADWLSFYVSYTYYKGDSINYIDLVDN